MRNFFAEGNGVFSPEYITKNYKKVGDKLIFCFFHDVIDELLFEHKIDYYQTIFGENNIVIYKYVDDDIYIVHGYVGAPAAVGMLEELIALGVRNVVFVGGAGYLRKDDKRNNLHLISSAISEEGTSHHYFDYDEEMSYENDLYFHFRDFLNSKNVPFKESKTWTTDAVYRETKAKINEMVSKGAALVEMEQSALIALAKYRSIGYAGLIYAGDDVSKDDYEIDNNNLSWRNSKDIRRDMVDYAHLFLKSE